MFTAVVDQLRFANSHTAFFACTLLHLFRTAHTDKVREIIARQVLFPSD